MSGIEGQIEADSAFDFRNDLKSQKCFCKGCDQKKSLDIIPIDIKKESDVNDEERFHFYKTFNHRVNKPYLMENWTPKFPEFFSCQVRLQSTKFFPKHNLYIDPLELASAGFFYCGNGDSVKCFYCGLGLHKWEKYDKPMYEHKRFAPHCKYIAMIEYDLWG